MEIARAIADSSIATLKGHRLRDVGVILDAHYLNRDPALVETRTKTPNWAKVFWMQNWEKLGNIKWLGFPDAFRIVYIDSKGEIQATFES